MEICAPDRDILNRLYQLFCYEYNEGDIGRDALYSLPVDSIFYVVKDGGIPCGFAEMCAERCLKHLFLTKGHRDSAGIREVLIKLFDSDTGRWTVPVCFESIVRI